MGRESRDASALCLLACSSTAVGALHLTSSVPSGSLILLSVEFYGQRFDTVNLELLARFFDKLPRFRGSRYQRPDPPLPNWWHTGAERTCAGVSVLSSKHCVERRGSTRTTRSSTMLRC